MNADDLRLLRSYANGPRIWDAAEILPRVHRLMDVGLIEPRFESNACQLTDKGRDALMKG